MSDTLNIGSPISQGNVGAKYEDSVAAWCMARMVCKEELSQIPGIPIEIGLQAKHKAPKIDDIYVRVQSGQETRDVFVQSKLTLKFTPSDSEYAETILAVRERIESGASEREVYVIAFQHNENNKWEHLERLLRYAQTPKNSAEWLDRAEKDPYVVEPLHTLRTILSRDGKGTDDDLLYRVCKQLRLWKKEFMMSSARDKEEALIALRDYVRGDHSVRRLFWNSLINIVSREAGVRGSFTRQSLINDPELRSLYKEPGVSDPTANQISEMWLDERMQRAKQLGEDMKGGRAYESLLEVEAELAAVDRMRLLCDPHTPSGEGLAGLAAELVLSKGSGIYVMDFAKEIPGWIKEAKELPHSEALWSQIGRCAYAIGDRASLDEACQHVRGLDQLALLKLRLSLLDGNEEAAWRIAESAKGLAETEVFGIRAGYLISHLNGDVLRLSDALAFAERHADAWPDRVLPSLNFASAVFMAITPEPSPLYRRGVSLPNGNLGALLTKAKVLLIATLTGSAGQFEKNVAFSLLLPILRAFCDPNVPYVPVLDDFPAYLERTTALRTIGYAQSMLMIGKKDLAERALRMKLALEIDEDAKADLRTLLTYAETGDIKDDGPIKENPWFYRRKLYRQLSKPTSGSIPDLATALLHSATNLSCGPEAELILQVATGRAEFGPIVDDLVRNFPNSVETFNSLISYLDELDKQKDAQPDQATEEFIEFLRGDQRWTAIRRAVFELCEHLTKLLPSQQVLTTWLNWGINFDDDEQVRAMAERSRRWNLDELASMAEAWLAASTGEFKKACALLEIYGKRYQINGAVANFRDRCTLQAGLTRELIERRQVMLDDKDRLPSTAKFTVQALMLEELPQIAAETAKANLDDFIDDRIALRDFIFAGLRTHRLDLAPDALQRFHDLYPDDPYLWQREITGEENILEEFRAEHVRRQEAYEQVKIPLHFLGEPFTEKWFKQINSVEGLQARRTGMSGLELERLEEGQEIWLDFTALFALSKYRLWSRLSSYHLKTSASVVEGLRGDLRVMTLQFDKGEFDKHDKYQRLLNRGNVVLYSFLPEEAKKLINKSSYNNGEAETALQTWLNVPFISTFSNREPPAYRLQDLIYTLSLRGIIRVLDAERWLEQLSRRHQGTYDQEPVEVLDTLDKIMIDDIDLRDVSSCDFAEEFMKCFEQVILGPAATLGYTLVTSPHLWAKKALDFAGECKEAMELAISEGRLHVIECARLPNTDDAAFIEQMVGQVASSDIFWCDDALMRSVIAHETGARTGATYQIVRALKSAEVIDDRVYRDIICQLGNDGHRDIDGDDLLIACAKDSGFRPNPQLLRCAHRLGHSLKPSSTRTDAEAEFIRTHVSYHVTSFVRELSADGGRIFADVCMAIAEGAGVLGGRAFWPRMLTTVRQNIHGDRYILLSSAELAIAEAGQIDLAERVHTEASMRRTANTPQLVDFPSPEAYLASLRLRNF